MPFAEVPLLEAGASADALLQAGDLLDAGVLTVDAALDGDRLEPVAGGRDRAERGRSGRASAAGGRFPS